MLKFEDATKEYAAMCTAAKGEVIIEKGFLEDLHPNERKMADLIANTFGGTVVLLKEKNLNNIKSADFLWHDKLWDLKDVSSATAVDNAVRKGLKQIFNNPGGIILDFGKNRIDHAQVRRNIEGRLRRGFSKPLDFIIISHGQLDKAYRYKK